ncbi:MAG: putative toxin-antitoxin system toxin component, PIN family [Nitrospirota bacterium]
MDRVVLDTNQIVSGLLMRRGAQAELLDAWRDRRFLLVTSPVLLNEVEEVLSQARLRQKYHLRDDQIERFLTLLRIDSLQVVGNVQEPVCRDPDDDAILVCAVEGHGRYLITGDHDLLVLKEYRGIRILTARHYLERLHLER